MIQTFVFDMDGVLTEPCLAIDVGFGVWLDRFVERHDVVLVSGSAVEQMRMQYNNPRCVYVGCSGNEIDDGEDRFVWDWRYPWVLVDRLRRFVDESAYPGRAGKHLDFRTGVINFSVVGRRASAAMRRDYNEWDRFHGERRRIVGVLLEEFPELDAQIGGEISIDIFPKGMDKSQLMRYFIGLGKVVFFGDRTEPGGNDHTLAVALAAAGGVVHTVKDWKETFSILKEVYDDNRTH